jgi:hypothetical protein
MNIDNPFGTLKIPANASFAEIKSAGQMMVARLRLSDATNTKQIRAVEQAIEQLRDPVARFKFGLEWPSLGPEAAHLLATDLSLLVRSPDIWADRATAIERLVVGESLNSREHIWAVFMLRHAHEVFHRAIASQESSLSDASKHELRDEANSFVMAINQWNGATREPQFWMTQRMRAKEIDDPRVGVELIAACQSDIFSIAIQGFVSLASDALRVRNAAVCSAIVDSINGCDASRVEIEKALTDVYSQICASATGALNGLQEKLKTTKSKSQAPYRKLLSEYSQVIHPDIESMLAVGDLPGTSEERCRDSAAEFLRSLAVDAANNSGAYEVSREALAVALIVVHSEPLRTQIKADVEVLSNLLRLVSMIFAPITSPPFLRTKYGFGTTLSGDTVYLLLLYIPALALGRYRVEQIEGGEYLFVGKLRVWPWDILYNRVMLCVGVALIFIIIALVQWYR